MNPETTPATSEVSPAFRWRDRHGVFHDVREMETRHLFYTVRMVWNHIVPTHLQLRPFVQYAFSSFYTTKYMTNAVYHTLRELNSREIPAEYADLLKWMISHANTHLKMRIKQ